MFLVSYLTLIRAWVLTAGCLLKRLLGVLGRLLASLAPFPRELRICHIVNASCIRGRHHYFPSFSQRRLNPSAQKYQYSIRLLTQLLLFGHRPIIFVLLDSLCVIFLTYMVGMYNIYPILWKIVNRTLVEVYPKSNWPINGLKGLKNQFKRVISKAFCY